MRDKPKTIGFQEGSAARKINTPCLPHLMINCPATQHGAKDLSDVCADKHLRTHMYLFRMEPFPFPSDIGRTR